VHPYYTVALAPAIAALVGLGGAVAWSRRNTWAARFGLAAAGSAASVWGFALLSENATWLPWLRWTLLVGGLLAAGAVLVSGLLDGRAGRRMLAAGLLAGLLFGLGGAASYAVGTASVAHSGSIPSVGTTSSMTAGGGAPTGSAPSGSTVGAPGSSPSGASSSASAGTTETSSKPSGSDSASGGQGTGGTGSAALTKLLAKADTKWSAAVDGSESAATLELSSNTAVLAIGGWSSDPTPTLAQFKALVAAGEVHYYIASGTGGGMGGGTSTASAIATWVKANFTATTIGGSTVYDLTSAS
jgi:hypothetical protein